VQKLLVDKNSPLKEKPEILVSQADVQMHLPVHVGDYTDFYSSIEHATNVGKMFRDPENALLPNWKHIPVGYHGRASSIVVSGTPIKRPKGQVMPKDATEPVFKPSARLDFELEMGFITGKNTQLGDSVSTADADDYIFGLVLFNDWSARDIQKWEYVPLGPFLGKSFGSSMSPWIVTLEALEPFKVAGPKQDPKVLPYLKYTGKSNYDIQLEVGLQPEKSEETVVSTSNLKYMYWNMQQQLAHHTINGCNINVGDVMASGTISGKDESSYGSMLEISWGGTKPVTLKDGSTRTFIEDNDTVIMRGFAEKDGIKVGFGEVSGKILPSD
jgi:fumarylacetoacetase